MNQVAVLADDVFRQGGNAQPHFGGAIQPRDVVDLQGRLPEFAIFKTGGFKPVDGAQISRRGAESQDLVMVQIGDVRGVPYRLRYSGEA